MNPDLIYQISLTQVSQVGSVHARTLLQHFGSAEEIFKSPLASLEAMEGIGRIRAQSIKSFRDFAFAEREIYFLRKYGVRAISMKEPDYPQRLLNTYDAPTLLFYKGTADLNHPRIVSIVGTRRNTDYGKQITEKLIHELSAFDPLIISGLAFGIDAVAHKAALKKGLPTIAVLAHGLSSLYPPEHSQLSKQMLKQGGLLTEYPSHIKADKHHFPIRNRIVAGMSDCTIVTETAVKGGSMITADLANGYQREVFAFPGRTTDFKSAGCNWLIRNNQAFLLESTEALVQMMGWDEKIKKKQTDQGELFVDLTNVEQQIMDLFKERDQMHIEVINARSGFSGSVNAGALLELEMKDLIRSMPGRIYKLNA